MKKRQVDYHPKILREARLLEIDKFGDFIFDTDCGKWSIDPDRLSGITKRDVNLIGTLTRYTVNGRDKYKWIEDIKEQEEQPVKKGKKNELTRGLTVGKLAKKFFK